jgi:hypothetical protein
VTIDGTWTAQDFAHLLTQFDQVYSAVGALTWLAEWPDRAISIVGKGDQAAGTDDTIRAALNFYLPGPLNVLSIQYGSIGAFVASGLRIVLAPVAKLIGDMRETNRKREEQLLVDTRERRSQDIHEKLEQEKIRLEYTKVKVKAAIDLLDRLPEDLRGERARELLDRAFGPATQIALEPRVLETELLEDRV